MTCGMKDVAVWDVLIGLIYVDAGDPFYIILL